MESNISLVCLKSKDDANVPKEQAAQTKGYFSDAEPMREANPFFSVIFLPFVRNSLKCYLQLRYSRTLTVPRNRIWILQGETRYIWNKKVQESNLKSSRRIITRALARSFQTSSILLLAMINNLLWNIRGIGNIKSRRRVGKLVKMYNISLIAILEPLHHANKIQEFSNRIRFNFSLANQEADDKIWLCWNHEVHVVLVDAFEQCITVDIGFLNSDRVRLTVLYAKCSIQRLLWEKLPLLS